MNKTQVLLVVLGIGISLWIRNHYFLGRHSVGMREELIEQAKADRLNDFKTLLKSKPDSATVYLDQIGCDLLQKAAAAGSLEIVEFLLYEKKLDINCNESSPLFYASSMGRSKMVLFLLQNGALIRPNGYEQETSLHVAAGTNPDMWVEREGVDFSTIDMLSVVKILVEHGADVNAVHRYGETPLHQAAFVQNYAIVKYLLEHHADINKKDKYGRTALHQAVFTNKDNRVCALLLENGANASSKNDKGQSPILWGYSNVDTSTIHLLMRFGYNPFQDVDNEGYTLLHRALQHQQYTTIYFLLDNKVNVNATTKMGTTPFHIAAGLRGAAGLNILKRLIQDGALINQKDTFGHTPLSGVCHVIESDHGTYYPDSLVVNFLRSQGAHE